jgi:hypothetical protein
MINKSRPLVFLNNEPINYRLTLVLLLKTKQVSCVQDIPGFLLNI